MGISKKWVAFQLILLMVFTLVALAIGFKQPPHYLELIGLLLFFYCFLTFFSYHYFLLPLINLHSAAKMVFSLLKQHKIELNKTIFTDEGLSFPQIFDAVITKLQASHKTINLLVKTTEDTQGVHDFNLALHGILQSICVVLEWPVGHVYFVNADETLLLPSDIWFHKHSERTPHLKELLEVEIKKGQGIPGKILETRGLLWVENINVQSFPRVEAFHALGLMSAVGFPIITNNKIIAVLEFFSFAYRKEDADVMNAFKIMSQQLSRVFEFQQTQQRLQNLEARKRTNLIIDRTQEAYVAINQTSHIVEWNQSAERIFGWQREEVIGKMLTETIIPPQHREAHMRGLNHYLKTQDGPVLNKRIEITALRKSGEEFPVELSITPILFEKEHIFSAFINDISQRKKAEIHLQHTLQELRETNQNLEKYAKLAEEANRLKTVFLANMSHELRTPLNGIIGFSEILHQKKLGELNETQLNSLEDILTSAYHLLQLINDLLDLAKIDAGKLNFFPENINAKNLVEEVLDNLKSAADKKTIYIKTQISPALAELYIDPVKFKQVLYNYLSNAIKFSYPKGEVRLHVYEEDADFFIVRVEDEGIGLSLMDQQKLFVEFEQLTIPSKIRHQGSGLGLALTKRLVEAQGGKVWIESEKGRGSNFYARLPRRYQSIMNPIPNIQ